MHTGGNRRWESMRRAPAPPASDPEYPCLHALIDNNWRFLHAACKEIAMALMNGTTYRESLRDGRQVWIEGEKVADVTRHPAFVPMVSTVSEIYDLHFTAPYSENLVYRRPDGELASRFYKLP